MPDQYGIPTSDREWRELQENDREAWSRAVKHSYMVEELKRKAELEKYERRRRAEEDRILKEADPKRKLRYSYPTSTAEWDFLRKADPAELKRAEERLSETALALTEEPGISLYSVDLVLKGVADATPEILELARWTRHALLQKLGADWIAWRDSEGLPANVAIDRVKKTLGGEYKIIGMATMKDGTARMMGKSVPGYVHDEILALEQRHILANDECKWFKSQGASVRPSLTIVQRVISAEDLQTAPLGEVTPEMFDDETRLSSRG